MANAYITCQPMYFFVALVLSVLVHTPAARIEPFELNDVQLGDQTINAKAAALNTEYLFLLDPDRLLWTFRNNAELPIPKLPYQGTWEDPNCEVRGQFMGHYLSALSFVWLSTGNTTAKARIDYLVGELIKVQEALGGGYLSAFPEEHFDRLQALQGVWAPYYVIHKIMNGLLDAHCLAGNEPAFGAAQSMASYFLRRIDATLAENGTDHWNEMLETEFGGMNDVMYRMYQLTGNPDHLRMAHLFDKPRFYLPMIQNHDVLNGLHANTHLAQVVGFANRYDTVQDPEALAAVANFFEIVTQNHSYATGGSNDNEAWWQANRLADAIINQRNALVTEETCTQYNILKIARSLFRWTGDARLADFYERGLVNGILGVNRMPTNSSSDIPAMDHHHYHHYHDHNNHHHHLHHHGYAQQLTVQGLQMETSGGATHRFNGHQMNPSLQDLQDLHDLTDLTYREEDKIEDWALDEDEGQDHSAQPLMVNTDPALHGQATGCTLHAGSQPTPPFTSATSPHRRQRSTARSTFLGFKGPDPGEEASNAPGPGVYLYLLPLGAGQSKGDNGHHWGFPFHSFWCCYGTSVELFSKLADSIYFREEGPSPSHTGAALSNAAAAAAAADTSSLPVPRSAGEAPYPRLYINQLVTSSVHWKPLGVQVNMEAELYAPGPSAAASVHVSTHSISGVPLTLMFRVPAWAINGSPSLRVNGQPWVACPGAPRPGTFCQITRSWHSGDQVDAVLGLGWSFMPLPEERLELTNLKAIMHGPFVMAGLTHDTRELVLDEASLGQATRDVDQAPTDLVSIQAGWDASLYIRHDMYHMYVSSIEDNGDAIDATFRVVKGCNFGGSRHHDTEPEELFTSSRLDGGAQHIRAKPSMAQQAEDGVMLESMNFPGFYVSFDMGGTMILQPRPNTQAQAKGGDSTHAQLDSFCAASTFRLVQPGLTQDAGTLSLEALAQPGHFVSAFTSPQPPCWDYLADCPLLARKGMCANDTGLASTQCRYTCGRCSSGKGALRLLEQKLGSCDFAKASTFRLASPLTPRYPPGSRIVAGLNRQYLLVPLGNIVDERYTVYFRVQQPDPDKDLNTPHAAAD